MVESTAQIDAFVDSMARHFPHAPTDGQGRLIHALARFHFSTQPRCAIMIRGYAGTGKTTSVGALVRVLREYGQRPVLLAPTGRAAKVMQSYAHLYASTIHRLIYRTKRSGDGNPAFGLAPNTRDNTVFIVDEASMIGEGRARSDGGGMQYRSLLDDLMEFVFSGEGCRLVLVGDDAQLPPVGESESPALNENQMRRDFALTVATVRLTDVVRQEMDSGILFNAHRLRLQHRHPRPRCRPLRRRLHRPPANLPSLPLLPRPSSATIRPPAPSCDCLLSKWDRSRAWHGLSPCPFRSCLCLHPSLNFFLCPPCHRVLCCFRCSCCL